MPKRCARSTSRASCSSNSRRLSSWVSGSVLACFWIRRCRRAFSIATAPCPTSEPTRSASSRPNGRSGVADEREQAEHALLGHERRREQRHGLVADHGLARLQRAALDALAVAHGRVEQSGGGTELAAPQLLDEHVRALVGDQQARALGARELHGRVDDDLEQAGHVVRCGERGAEALAELLHAPALGVELVDALLELARHVVEDRAELRELVASAHGQALVEAARGDGADAVGEAPQRVRERAHGERGAGADQQQQEAHEERHAQPDRARVVVELAAADRARRRPDESPSLLTAARYSLPDSRSLKGLARTSLDGSVIC